jgi:putative ABC transport system permease protein
VLLRVDITFGVVLGLLLIVAVAVAALARLGWAGGIAVAGVRAAVQLGLVALVIGWVVGAVALGACSPARPGP